MGNSFIWFYPKGATAPVAIDVGRKLTDIQLGSVREVYDIVPTHGVQNRQDLGGSRVIRFIIERTRDAANIRKLRSLATHLQSNGPIAISLDVDKTFGSFARPGSLPEGGDTSLFTRGNLFAAFNAGTLVNGDEVTIESANPEMLREWREVSSFTTGGVVQLTEPVLYTYENAPIFIRFADFYPVLYLPEQEVNLADPSSDRRINWTWDLTLIELPGAIAALLDNAEGLGLEGSPTTGGATKDLGQAVNAGVKAMREDQFTHFEPGGR